MDSLIPVVGVAAALLLLYQARRVQDGKTKGIQPASRGWLLFSLVPLGIAIYEGASLLAGESVLEYLPMMTIMSGLTVYMWWKAWRLRQAGQ